MIKLEYVLDLLPDISDSKLMQRFLVYEDILSMSISKQPRRKPYRVLFLRLRGWDLLSPLFR